MNTFDDNIRRLLSEAFNVTTVTPLDVDNGSCTAGEAGERCNRFLAHVKEILDEEPSLSERFGTMLSNSLWVTIEMLLLNDSRQPALEAFRLSLEVLNAIDPAEQSDEEKRVRLYKSIDAFIQDLPDAADDALIDAIYDTAFHSTLARDGSTRDDIQHLRSQGLTGLLMPSWEDEDDELFGILKYHEGKGNVPATIPMDTRVPFDERAFSEGMARALGIRDRPVIAGDIDAIIALELRDSCIRWACDLEFMPRLRFVKLAGNAISDIKFIAELREVEVLSLSGNQIRDLSPIADMHSLTVLDLSDNAIADVSPLAGLADLRELNLDDNCIHFVSPLRGLAFLESLSIAGNPVKDAAGLLALPALQVLHVSRNQIAEETLAELRERGVSILFRAQSAEDTN